MRGKTIQGRRLAVGNFTVFAGANDTDKNRIFAELSQKTGGFWLDVPSKWYWAQKTGVPKNNASILKQKPKRNQFPKISEKIEALVGKVDSLEHMMHKRFDYGWIQMGMLAWFIKNGFIGKGDKVFAFEPEAHLHPAWQEEYLDALYKLHKGGVKIFISTNSPLICQKIEFYSKVAYNFFEGDKVITSLDEEEDWSVHNKIAKNLERPAYQLYIQSMFGEEPK